MIINIYIYIYVNGLLKNETIPNKFILYHKTAKAS